MSAEFTYPAGGSLNTPANTEGLYWPLLALLTAMLVTAGSIIWNYEHPFGFNWDESVYFNEMQMDVSTFHGHGISGLIKGWLVDDPLRPPAYRVFAFPFAILFGPGPFVLRCVAIFFRIITLALLYLGVRQISNRDAAAVSVILLALCPDFVFFNMIFYNEYALYLASAGMCYWVFRSWDKPSSSIGNCLGLGIFLGIGALSKASFPALAGGFLGLVAILYWRKKISGPNPQFLLNACVVGALIAGPWWLLNFHSGLDYIRYAANFSRTSTGPAGITSALHFVFRFVQEGLGLPIASLCLVLIIAALVRYGRARASSVPEASFWAAICLLLAPLPTLLGPLLTHNQIIYHTSQSLILLAAGFALVAKNAGWLSYSMPKAFLSLGIFAQLSLTMTPVVLRWDYPGHLFAWTAMAQWDQWDWNELRALLRSQGLQQPSIAYIGDLSPLNPPEIMYPWLSHHEQAPPVTLLWRLEYGAPDMPALIAAAVTNDVVLTVPDLTNANDAGPDFLDDNKYNMDFASQMLKSISFHAPLHLHLGRRHPMDVWVFIRKDSHDRPALQTPALNRSTIGMLRSVSAKIARP